MIMQQLGAYKLCCLSLVIMQLNTMIAYYLKIVHSTQIFKIPINEECLILNNIIQLCIHVKLNLQIQPVEVTTETAMLAHATYNPTTK